MTSVPVALAFLAVVIVAMLFAALLFDGIVPYFFAACCIAGGNLGIALGRDA